MSRKPQKLNTSTINNTAVGRKENKWLLAGLIAMVCVITAAVYWPVLSAKAVSFDDEYYLLGNKLVQNPSFASAVRFFREVLNPSTVKGYYQPLTMISLMVDCAFGGGPKYFMPFHVTSLIFHLLNTALVIVFLYMLLGNIWAAAIIGLLFGIHPITIESIPWISERKTLLAAFFAICSLIFYVKYVKNTESRIQNSVEKCKKSFTTVYCLLTTVFYLLALLSKPSAMPLPFLMLVLDFWPLKRLGKKAFLEKTPLFIICAVFVVFAVISQRTFGMRGPGSYSAADTVLLICHNNLAYLCNIFWPVNLSLFYAFPTWIPIPVIIIATMALAAGLIISLRWTRALSAGWLFFFLAIFPVLGVTWVHDMIIADRHAYLPMLGIFIMVSYLLSAAAGRKNILAAVLMLAGVAAVSEAFLTRRHLAYWKDTETHHRRMVETSPDEPIVHNSLGIALFQQGRFDEAVGCYRKALTLRTGIEAFIHYNMANALMGSKKFSEAAEHYAESARQNPDQASTYDGLGWALANTGRVDEAVENYKKALKIDEGLIAAHGHLGLALAGKGDTDGAIREFRTVLEASPGDADMYCNIGVLLEQQGKKEQAIEEYQKTLQISPAHIRATKRLGDLKGQIR